MSVGKNITFGGWLLTTSLLVVAPLAGANDLDVTMRMVEDSEDLTNSVTREIRLPELPARRDRAIDRGQARPEAPGREVSKEARERGREFGQSASEQAREARGKSRNRELTGCHSGLVMPVNASRICRHNRHVRNFSLMVTSRP